MDVTIEVENEMVENGQNLVGSSVKRVRNASRKAALAYVGLWGLAYDEAKSWMDYGQELVERAEKRGTKVEEQATDDARRYYKEATKRVRRSTEEPVQEVEAEVETRMEQVLERLGIPTRKQLVELEARLDKLNDKLAQTAATKAVVKAKAPIDGYEELTVDDVEPLLPTLSPGELKALAAYEEKHKNRVTLLRAIDEQLEQRQTVDA